MSPNETQVPPAASPHRVGPRPRGLAPAAPRTGAARYAVLGVPVDALDLDAAVEAVIHAVAARPTRAAAGYVCVRDVNGVVACQRDPVLQRIHEEATLVTPDGMPVVWWGRLAGHRRTGRVYGPDLMLALCRRSRDLGLRHFLCGGNAGVADELAAALRRRCPGLAIVGTYTPPFRPLSGEERRELVQRINDSGADIVWVGLSSPKQERFMADLAPDVACGVLIGVGAAFDFLSGRKPQAPRWIQRSGFEWLFRFLSEPRRLGRRYMVNNSVFLWLTARLLVRAVLDRRRRHGGAEAG